MPKPTTYPLGVNDRPYNHAMGSLPIPDPTKHQIWHDDFQSFTVAAAGVTGWIKTEVNTGALDPTVQDLAGGVIKFTIDNADEDNAHFAWGTNTTVHEPFAIVAGKKAWLRVKFKTEDADKDIFAIGLQNTAGDPFTTEPTEQFYFRSLRAAPDSLVFAVGKANTTEQTIALGTMADDTWVVCTAYYDGANTVYAWRETAAGVITNTGSVSVTSSVAGDLLPDAELGVAFGMEATDTGADDMHCDFISVIIER
jgi:hypothetical protein